MKMDRMIRIDVRQKEGLLGKASYTIAQSLQGYLYNTDFATSMFWPNARKTPMRKSTMKPVNNWFLKKHIMKIFYIHRC